MKYTIEIKNLKDYKKVKDLCAVADINDAIFTEENNGDDDEGNCYENHQNLMNADEFFNDLNDDERFAFVARNNDMNMAFFNAMENDDGNGKEPEDPDIEYNYKDIFLDTLCCFDYDGAATVWLDKTNVKFTHSEAVNQIRKDAIKMAKECYEKMSEWREKQDENLDSKDFYLLQRGILRGDLHLWESTIECCDLNNIQTRCRFELVAAAYSWGDI